jgi:hypothetical protein
MEVSNYAKGQAVIFESTPLIDRLKPVAIVKEVSDYAVSGEVEITGEGYTSERRNSFSINIKDGKLTEVWCYLDAISKDKVEEISISHPVLKVKELSEKAKKQLEKLKEDLLNSGITGFNRDYDISHGGGEHLNLAFEDAFIVPFVKYGKDGEDVITGFTVQKLPKVKANFYGYGFVSLEQLKEITKSKDEKITLSDERPPSGAGGSCRDHFWHGVYKKKKVKSADNGSYPGEGLAG